MRWLVLAFLLGSSLANAGEAFLSWTPPTENDDGSPLTDLAGYKVYYGTTQGGQYTTTINLPNPSLTGYVVEDLAPGTYYFVLTAFNQAGVESNFSNETTKTVPEPRPNPPTDLVVIDPNLTAYTFDKIPGGLSVYPIGTVPAGTPCDPSVEVNGKFMVPAEAVIYPIGVNLSPFVVVAECGSGG